MLSTHSRYVPIARGDNLFWIHTDLNNLEVNIFKMVKSK